MHADTLTITPPPTRRRDPGGETRTDGPDCRQSISRHPNHGENDPRSGGAEGKPGKEGNERTEGKEGKEGSAGFTEPERETLKMLLGGLENVAKGKFSAVAGGKKQGPKNEYETL
jgi:hypothetical protein